MTARDRSRHRGPGVPAGRMMASEQQSVLEPGVPEVPVGSRPAPRPTAAGRLQAALRARRRWLVPLLVVLLLAQMAAAMVTTAVQQTPTIDEPVYVATATDYLHEHRLPCVVRRPGRHRARHRTRPVRAPHALDQHPVSALGQRPDAGGADQSTSAV
ncbi:hypothetical protein ABZ372_42270, partial [Streptomyces sp. NPDC005921]